MHNLEQPEVFEEQQYLEDGEPSLLWFVFRYNVIPFRYDPTQGGWLYVHGMQLINDERVDALHAADVNIEGGVLMLGYPYTAEHRLDELEKWVYIEAPLRRYLELTGYFRGLEETTPEEQRKLQEIYRIFVQTLNFEGLPYRDKCYLMAKHRQFQRRLANGYYEGLR